MKKSTKFSDVLHILLHMAGSTAPATSEILAKAMKTNPVVVRRTMAGLRKRGIVKSEKGHGGGWQLVRDMKFITLHDVYESIGAPTILAIGNRAESPPCLIEKAVNAVTRQAFQEAESLLIANFRKTTLEELHRIVKKLSGDRISAKT